MNVDENQSLSAKFKHSRAIPTLLIFKNGQVRAPGHLVTRPARKDLVGRMDTASPMPR